MLTSDGVKPFYDLSANEHGDVALAYTAAAAADLPSELRVLRYSKAAGWGPPEGPAVTDGAWLPAVGVSPDGQVVALWHARRGPAGYDIWASQARGPEWTQPVLIGSGAVTNRQDDLALAVGKNVAMAAWLDLATFDVRVAQLD
jgi:hypothetical protein